MTPEQILIDGLNQIAQWDDGDRVGPHFDEPGSAQQARETLQAYNEAKAKQKLKPESFKAQPETKTIDLLTASPDRAALLTAAPLADACEIALSVLQDVDGTSPEYDAIQYAIAQSDELVDHSKKVWDLLRVRRDTHGLNCVFYEGEKHCNCGFDEYTEIKESLPDDILVLMEVGDDDY